MKETLVALESAGLSLADWVARARREQTTVVVVDAAVPVARLVPASVPSCTGAQLARALDTTDLSTEEARVWVEDLRQARSSLNAPEDPWR